MGDLTQEKFRFQSFSPEVEKTESSTLEIKDTKVAIFDILRAEGDELLTFLEDVDVDYSSIKAKIIGRPINFPNPFRASTGTKLGYELSKSMDIDIKIYNSFAQLVHEIHIDSGQQGATSSQYNKVDLNAYGFNDIPKSSGVYFYVIMNEGKVIGKGKMVVLP